MSSMASIPTDKRIISRLDPGLGLLLFAQLAMGGGGGVAGRDLHPRC